MEQQSSLLILPDELQRQIYDYFISSWSLAFGDVAEIFGIKRTTVYKKRLGDNFVLFPNPQNPTTYALRRTCQRIRRIVSDLSRRTFSGHFYTLYGRLPENLNYPYSSWKSHVHSIHVLHIGELKDHSNDRWYEQFSNLRNLDLFISNSEYREIDEASTEALFRHPDSSLIKSANEHLGKLLPVSHFEDEKTSFNTTPSSLYSEITVRLINYILPGPEHGNFGRDEIRASAYAIHYNLREESTKVTTRAITDNYLTFWWQEGIEPTTTKCIEHYGTIGRRHDRTCYMLPEAIDKLPPSVRWAIPYKLRCCRAWYRNVSWPWSSERDYVWP